MALFESSVFILARKFLLSKHSDRFLSFIAWVSVVGVALGVLALTIVTSVINGFEGQLSQVITGMNGDALLFSKGEPIRDRESIEAQIRKVVPDTQAITASFLAEVMIAGPQAVSGAVLEGFDPTTWGEVTQVPRRVISGRLPNPAARESEVALGSALAEKIGADVDTELRIIAPFTGGADSSPKVLKAQVVGIIKMGMYDYDSKFAFMSLPAVQSFLDRPGQVTNFNLKLAPGASSRNAFNQLSESFGYPFRAKDWTQLNKNLFYAIQLEKAVIAIILTVIVIVAAFNVVSTLMMMIHDKTKEIAILKAMGFRPSQSFRLFCTIGVGIGLVGVLAGVLAGLGLGWVLGQSELVRLPADIYFIDTLPVMVRWNEIAWIAGVAIFISFLATIYPSWSVSRRSPLDGLRHE